MFQLSNFSCSLGKWWCKRKQLQRLIFICAELWKVSDFLSLIWDLFVTNMAIFNLISICVDVLQKEAWLITVWLYFGKWEIRARNKHPKNRQDFFPLVNRKSFLRDICCNEHLFVVQRGWKLCLENTCRIALILCGEAMGKNMEESGKFRNTRTIEKI